MLTYFAKVCKKLCVREQNPHIFIVGLVEKRMNLLQRHDEGCLMLTLRTSLWLFQLLYTSSDALLDQLRLLYFL